VAVAFLDVSVYVTSIGVLKNLLLIGDQVKSVWFVAFQVSRGVLGPKLVCMPTARPPGIPVQTRTPW
jgi:hypothetical protein